MSTQPEALRLADWLDADACDLQTPRLAAAELRRQHADIEQLKAQVFLQMKWKTDAQNENERLLEINAELLEALKGMVALEEETLRGGDDDDISIELRRARAAIARAEEVKP